MRIGQGETSSVDAAHWFGEEYLHHGVLIDVICARRWITGNVERRLVCRRAINCDDPVAYRHGYRRRSFNHSRFSGRLAAITEASEHAGLKDEVVVGVGHIAKEMQSN